MSSANKIVKIASTSANETSSTLIKHSVANELVFAVVGPAGSGTSWIALALKERLRTAIPHAQVEILKASTAIENWAVEQGKTIETAPKLKRATDLQDAGDAIRLKDAAGVAVRLISEIKKTREAGNQTQASNDANSFKVFILDSLKHPAEVALLRSVYQDAFSLIGVVCESATSKDRLRNEKCHESSGTEIDGFISRDQDSGLEHGQKVADAFHLADFFVNNTPDRFLDAERKKENPEWDVNDQLGRLIDILTHSRIERPTADETGMFHAYGAQMRSACLSRQVGAALMDKLGNLVSTGTNEVPSAGGGVYGNNFSNQSAFDDRCAVTKQYCSNGKNQDRIIQELINTIPALKTTKFVELKAQLKHTSIGRLLEFSRAVHAEMDALLSAARQGISPVGGRLFVTTFPCHYCARHIVSAGVDEVQYIEPYPKSLAWDLHGDAIAKSQQNWRPPTEKGDDESESRQVLFRPFTGVAPRLYRRAFMKDRSLKNADGALAFGDPKWASGLLRLSYRELEESLVESSKKLHE